LSRSYFAARIACPFLIDGSCSIHKIRPIACREYNVTSDPKLCDSPFDNKIQPLGLQRRMAERLHAVAVKLCGISPGNIVFPLIFEWYDTHRELASRTWPGPKLFELMLDLTMGSSKNARK
jgi:Fe-S-cluster containining protein